ADREIAGLGDHEHGLGAERDALRTEIAAAAAREAATREALEAVLVADIADRERLAEAERAAGIARDRLRIADTRLRGADHVELEARLGFEALRESVVVELGGLGDLAFDRVLASSDTKPLMEAADLADATPTPDERVSDDDADADDAIS